jgi:hypothetical protein
MLVFWIGTSVVVSLLLRCILFLIILAIELISDVYLFITLMITEVLMMFVVQLKLNQKFVVGVITGETTSAVPSGAHMTESETVSATFRSDSKF